MISFDDVTEENTEEHSPNWSQIPDHLCRLLIIDGCESGKTNSLFNLISHQPDIDKIYLYAKNPVQGKYQLLINNEESTSLKQLSDSKAFIEYSNYMDDIYKIFKNKIHIRNSRY